MNPHSLTRTVRFVLTLVIALTCTTSVFAQEMEMPKPAPEMDIFKQEVRNWECKIEAWESPEAAAKITAGSETNRMLGGFWLLTDFKGKMMGTDFQGHGTYGYDAEKKKYVGTWMDSLSPFMMTIEGDYDKVSRTITMLGDAPGPDGNTWTHIMKTTFKGDGKKVLTMHLHPKGVADQKMKLFEMTYSRKK